MIMEAAMHARPTTIGNRISNEQPNGNHFDVDNKAEIVSTRDLSNAEPIEVVGNKVKIYDALMQVDRPYGFVLGGVPLVVIKRKDGSADVYTTPPVSPNS